MRLIATVFSALAGLAAGCTLNQNYAQCQQDSDCPPNGAAKQFCTSDQICVPDTPEERLCAITEPAQPAAQAKHVGALLYMPPDAMTPAMTVRLHVLQHAVQEINELAKTDQAQPLALHICDISGSAGDAQNSFRVLVNKYAVSAVIGPDSQAALSDVVGLASSSSVPILSPAATASAVVQLPSRGYLLRMAPVDTQQASPISREVPNGSLLGLVSSEDSYGNNVRRSFLSSWMNRDSVNNKLRFSYSYNESTPGLLNMVASQLVANQPTYAVLMVSDTQAQLVQQLKDLPNPPGDPTRATQLVVSDSGHSDEMLALAARPDMAEHIARLRGIGPLTLSQSIEATEFKTAFQSHYPSDRLSSDVYAGYAYDALYTVAVIMNSIKGDLTGDAVLQVLRRMTNSMTVLPMSRVTFADTVRIVNQGDTFTLSGATGPIRFTPEGSRDPALFERWTIDTTTTPGKPTYVSTPL